MRTLCGTILAAAMAAHGAGGASIPEDFSGWVDPFVGTSATGHTSPAACVPFGLVQAGPDTGNGSWHYCSGYRSEDNAICGFTQTHLNGTGGLDLGDLRILPLKAGLTGLRDAGNSVNHVNPVEKLSEIAGPGYYAVTLDGGIKVEIAAAEHSAIYRISAREKLRLLVDCAYGIGGKNYAKTITASDVKLFGKSGLSGRNHRRQWVERDYSFAVKFSRECATVEEMPKSEGIAAPQYVFDFDVGESPLLIKVALSAEGDVAAAERNLAAEIPEWDFDTVKVAARAKWNEVLGRATIEGTDEQKKNWYTSLYHLFIQPNNIADVGAKPLYSTFSCWDTFRAAHPLYTIIAPDKAAEFVDSMLEQGRRTGYLPIWTLWGHDNQCMIGTHSVPVIVDWFLKDSFSRKERKGRKDEWLNNPVNPVKKDYWLAAYAQIRDTLTKPHKGRIKERWDLLDKYGYYPFDEIKGESVSRTMECAYDDWCAGMMAEGLGFKDDAEFFFKRAENWRNVFDPSIGLVRGKDTKGNWREPYNPYALGHGADLANDFTEGNAFQYTWHVMQNPQGLVGAMGGREAFVRKLDSLFLQPDTVEGSGCVVDVTGLIGQYVHGNEPSHHVIYFYPQVGHPEKAAERIREVFDKFYLPKPDGLCGNDDCGQMSAWYIFSAMGFYPFNPCGGEYIIGAPQVDCAKLKVESGEFKVVARNLSRENKYVKSVTLNGKPITDWKIRHSDIMRGGELVFEMTNASESDGGTLGGKEIRLGGDYAGHLQDVWREGNCLYWAHTLALVKTDLSGKVLAKTEVNEHHAGLEVKDGKVYVAVCDMQNKTGGKTLPDSRVTVKVYDAETLKLLESHVTDINDRSGSLAILEDGTFLVGCLRPPDISETQVRFHHLDANYKLIKSYVLDNVPVPLGIETIKRHNGCFYLNHYTKEALMLGQRTRKALCIKLDKDFKEVARYEVNGTCGLVFDGDSIWVGATWQEPGSKRWVSSLNRVDPPHGF